jgi:uncharacterized protein with GYD domain
MKFIMIGNFLRDGIADPADRATRTFSKAQELGISVLQRLTTIGRYDFCTLIEAPDTATASAFDHWYTQQNYGQVELLFVHEEADAARIASLLVMKGDS